MSVIIHEDSEMLQEVVVTGYTTQRKADLTGSISVVSMDEIAKQNENNPMKAMQGRCTGHEHLRPTVIQAAALPSVSAV